MTVREMQDEILRLKQEKDVCILAHTYQSHDVTEVADFTGDSFQLSLYARKAPQKTVLLCGVRFMAETVKMLSPEKRVVLSNENAGCPMAQQLSVSEIVAEKAKHPNCAVVAYINTTAELKAVCDVCVTSSSAVEIVKKLPQKDILFIPDVNLGAYVAERCPEKRLHFIRGGCSVHAAITKEEACAAKKAHPNALLLAHPECKAEVVKYADYVGSTAGIINFVRGGTNDEFIVGTEVSVAEHLAYEFPDKKFYPLSKNLICSNMKATSLPDVYRILKWGGKEIEMSAELIEKARVCIDKMLELG